MRPSNASSGLCVIGSDLYGGSGHTSGLDCPPGVEFGCRGDAVSPCRSGTPISVLTNPSNGVTVLVWCELVVAMGRLVVEKCVLQRVDKDTSECNKHFFPFLNLDTGVPAH